MKKLLFALLGASTFCLSHSIKADTLSSNGQATASYLQSLQHNPNGLLIFLQSMPKGGDLHNHRSGAAYAESMIAAGAATDLCLDPKTFTVTNDTNCPDNLKLKNLPQNSDLYNQTINAWSLRDFYPGTQESAHDHFFNTFLKYGNLSAAVRSQNLTDIVNRAGSQHELYLETMITVGWDAAMALGDKLNWNNNFDQMRQQLEAEGISTVVNDIQSSLNDNEAYLQKSLQCGTPQAQPGCNVTVRYQYITLRLAPPAEVFSQLMAGFELANKDPRVVAINLVGAEDDYTSLHDYHLQMQMIGYFHKLYPNVHIDLHAGELALGMVRPDSMTFHIRDAIETAHTERIGHGTDIAYENNSYQLLQEMASKHIPVELCLTSNADILNIKGNQSPITLYLKSGVPVVLATDDEGVLRTDLTHEFQRAILTYHFDYPTIKMFVRNSLTYNFMPGQSLWSDPKEFTPVSACARDTLGGSKPSPSCAAFLKESPKAQLQWQLEQQFTNFEKLAAANYRAQTALE